MARQARVLADHDAVLVGAAQEMRARRHADAHRHLRGHRRDIGQPAYPVGSEKLAHDTSATYSSGKDRTCPGVPGMALGYRIFLGKLTGGLVEGEFEKGEIGRESGRERVWQAG